MIFLDAFFSLCTGLNQPLKKNWKIAHWPLLIWVRSQISIPYMDCMQGACGSELWISSYLWRGQPSSGTTGCPADTLPLNVVCAIQEQLWDFRSGSLWEGLLHPRKPNNIAVVSMGFFGWFFLGLLTMRLKPLQRITLLMVLLAVVLPRQTNIFTLLLKYELKNFYVKK